MILSKFKYFAVCLKYYHPTIIIIFVHTHMEFEVCFLYLWFDVTLRDILGVFFTEI